MQAKDDTKTKSPKSPLYKRMRLMLIIVGGVFALIFLFDIARSMLMRKFFAHFALPAVSISSSEAKSESWTPMIPAVGSIVAVNGVQVSPEVSGMVVAIHFKSGEMVKANQPLVQLDDSTDQQDLKNLLAQLTLVSANFKRQEALFKTHSTSQASYEDAQATLEQIQAQVAKTQLIISKKLIKAPFDGKIGIRQVNLGQYVSPGTALVNLQSLEPLYVNFTLPEQYLHSLYVGQAITLKTDNYPDKTLTGTITGIDAAVDIQTRNILVQATIPNKDLKLYPGLFANINVLLPTKKNVITVPQTAISFSLYGNAVFVLTPNGKDKNGRQLYSVHIRYVTTGDQRDNIIAVTKGIKPGEEVVTSGQLKLENGAQAYVNNSVQLPNISPEELKKNRT